MNDCLFCKIAKGELPCYKIYEDRDFLAFLDINPVNPGHTLIIPKKHSETILDTDEETLKKLIIVVKKVSTAIYNGLKCEGFNIGANQFKYAGQLVPHLHIHIMPRNKGDGIRLWPSRKYESEKEKIEVQKKITRLLK